MESFSASLKAKVEAIKSVVKVYADFPKPGVNFVDYFSVMRNPAETKILTEATIERLETHFPEDDRPNVIVGLETRGFFLGILLAQHWMIPFVPIRKLGKLPGETLDITYEKEYGKDGCEIQKDALNAESKVLIVDDLLATGGTLEAAF